MKAIYLTLTIFLTLVALSFQNELQDVLSYLANADSANLRDELKPIVENLKRSMKAGEHSYCCAIEQQNSTEQIRSRLVKIEAPHTTKVIVGYKPCNGSSTNNQVSFPSLSQLLAGFSQFGTFQTPTTPTTPAGCTLDPIYENVTYMKTTYAIEYYKVTVVISNCPIQHQICCEGYTMLLGNCVDSAIVPNLQDLINLGLIGK